MYFVVLAGLGLIVVCMIGVGKISETRAGSWPGEARYAARMRTVAGPLGWYRAVARFAGRLADGGWGFGESREGQTRVLVVNLILLRPVAVGIGMFFATVVWLVVALPILLVTFVVWLAVAMQYHWLWHELRPSARRSRRARQQAARDAISSSPRPRSAPAVRPRTAAQGRSGPQPTPKTRAALTPPTTVRQHRPGRAHQASAHQPFKSDREILTNIKRNMAEAVEAGRLTAAEADKVIADTEAQQERWRKIMERRASVSG